MKTPAICQGSFDGKNLHQAGFPTDIYFFMNGFEKRGAMEDIEMKKLSFYSKKFDKTPRQE